MNCRSCGRALEPASRFCSACGTPVESACTTCGVALAADARFCTSCGTPVGGGAPGIATESPDTGRERKVATMVFADLVGFTSLNESSDPELVQA
jgi:class 3 adenylate cyclase